MKTLRKGPARTRGARLFVAALSVAGVSLVTTGGAAEAWTNPAVVVPGSTQACTAYMWSYPAQSQSYAKTQNTTGCNEVAARIRFSDGSFGGWYYGGSGTAAAPTMRNDAIGGSHKRCNACATHDT